MRRVPLTGAILCSSPASLPPPWGSRIWLLPKQRIYPRFDALHQPCAHLAWPAVQLRTCQPCNEARTPQRPKGPEPLRVRRPPPSASIRHSRRCLGLAPPPCVPQLPFFRSPRRTTGGDRNRPATLARPCIQWSSRCSTHELPRRRCPTMPPTSRGRSEAASSFSGLRAPLRHHGCCPQSRRSLLVHWASFLSTPCPPRAFFPLPPLLPTSSSPLPPLSLPAASPSRRRLSSPPPPPPMPSPQPPLPLTLPLPPRAGTRGRRPRWQAAREASRQPRAALAAFWQPPGLHLLFSFLVRSLLLPPHPSPRRTGRNLDRRSPPPSPRYSSCPFASGRRPRGLLPFFSDPWAARDNTEVILMEA